MAYWVSYETEPGKVFTKMKDGDRHLYGDLEEAERSAGELIRYHKATKVNVWSAGDPEGKGELVSQVVAHTSVEAFLGEDSPILAANNKVADTRVTSTQGDHRHVILPDQS
jgi:hypothetical protein